MVSYCFQFLEVPGPLLQQSFEFGWGMWALNSFFVVAILVINRGLIICLFFVRGVIFIDEIILRLGFIIFLLGKRKASFFY